MKILDKIHARAAKINRTVTLMEVCGGHTNTIMRYGIRDILPKNVRLISGPGCPVCVTAQEDIDRMIELALRGIPIATYGDMLRVPGSKLSLDDARSKGATIEMVYSATDVMKLRDAHPDIVFFGIGFETTAPMTAYLLSQGICVYSVHKLIPPAMEALLDSDIKIDGFIDPGHVSTIIGTEAYREIQIPQAICGFEPEQILKAVYILLTLIESGRHDVINGYPEAVRTKGNQKAQAMIRDHFKTCDAAWRGLGTIPLSGIDVLDDHLNARIVHKGIIKDVKATLHTGCRCGDVLKGKIDASACPLFRTHCTPENPKGACMVSEEGSCNITYRYTR